MFIISVGQTVYISSFDSSFEIASISNDSFTNYSGTLNSMYNWVILVEAGTRCAIAFTNFDKYAVKKNSLVSSTPLKCVETITVSLFTHFKVNIFETILCNGIMFPSAGMVVQSFLAVIDAKGEK